MRSTPAEHESSAARVAAALEEPRRASWFHAPGRVNLIGDHTDYNDGFVLPFAIDRGCTIAATPHGSVRVRSLDLGGEMEVAADGSTDPRSVEPPWGRYVAGVVAELAVRGRPPAGMDATLATDVPIGSGLSSSAALEVACAVGLVGMADWSIPPLELAEACRAAEELAAGVPCGIMDQLTSVAGRQGAAVLIDCRSRDISPVPMPVRLATLVVHSGVSRELATSAYADRRRACEELARRLGVPALRDVAPELVAEEPMGRHVVTENARVLAAAAALAADDLRSLGRLLDESHASLRDDFGVSTPELDELCRALVDAGALGARLTGAGFGGCVVAACEAGHVDAVASAAVSAYRGATGREATPFICQAAAGAARFEPDVTS